MADLLDIGPQDAILMSATADANAVCITGNEFRATGFSVGDKIRVYSDADPFGHEDLEIAMSLPVLVVIQQVQVMSN